MGHGPAAVTGEPGASGHVGGNDDNDAGAGSRARLPWPDRVVRFPGRDGHLLLPVERRAAATGLRGYSACSAKARAGRRAGLLVAALGRPGLLGPVTTVGCPLPDDVRAAFGEDLLAGFSRLTAVVPVLRRQPGRDGLGMLLLDASGERLGFAKVDRGGLAREAQVLAAASGRRLRAAVVPDLLRTGAAAGWSWFVTTALPDRATGMGDPPLADLTQDVATVLADLPRPGGVPVHWEPMHGDLTPWNVRSAAGRFHVFDWQDSGFGPPWADAVLYDVARAAVQASWRRRAAAPGRPWRGAGEAHRYWADVVAGRGDGTAADTALSSALTAQLLRGTTRRRSGAA